MSEDTADHDKQYDPSQKKLDDARKRGEIAKSDDLITAAGYGGFVVAAWATGAASLQSFGSVMSHLLDQPEGLAGDLFIGRSSPYLGGMVGELSPSLVPWVLFPASIAFLAILVQRGLVFAPEKLKPQLSRISLVRSIGNKFGRHGLFEFAKSFTKLSIYSAVLGVFLVLQSDAILGMLYLSPAVATAELLRLSLFLMGVVFMIALGIGLVDLVWQRAEHLRKNRMSRLEMLDEMKESEGDPAMKQQRRQKAVSLAMNQMLSEVPDADVVIVNPTHFAVALKWDKSSGRAPICVAKGIDALAMRIREVASEAGVPIRSDAPTARALYATIDIGDEILTEHYRAVAAAIRFAETLRRRARR